MWNKDDAFTPILPERVMVGQSLQDWNFVLSGLGCCDSLIFVTH